MAEPEQDAISTVAAPVEPEAAAEPVPPPNRRPKDPRAIAQAQLREMRARLSQGSSIKPEFEYELLAMYARNELSARVTLPLLAPLAAAWLLFEVPMVGSVLLLMLMIGLFMLANLAIGFTFSTLARNQLQAMQMTFFFFLPSMLLSGFMFPFRGMPQWAQNLGEVLPLTHFLRIVRGIMLKGNDLAQVLPELWPMLAFLFVAGAAALARYRRTLD